MYMYSFNQALIFCHLKKQQQQQRKKPQQKHVILKKSKILKLNVFIACLTSSFTPDFSES